MAAFNLAFKARDKGIELDVRVSADGELMVIHDSMVDRTTDGKGPVASMSLADLQSLDAASWFSPKFHNERIPHLAHVLAAAKGHGRVNVEIKFEQESRQGELEDLLLETIL